MIKNKKIKNKNKIIIPILIILSLVLISGCVPGDTKYEKEPASFWTGLWHGIIAPITLLLGLFKSNIQMFEFNNTGGWYSFGFLLGVLFFWGGCKHGHTKLRCKPLRCEHNSTQKKLKLLNWSSVDKKLKNKIKQIKKYDQKNKSKRKLKK